MCPAATLSSPPGFVDNVVLFWASLEDGPEYLIWQRASDCAIAILPLAEENESL
jgi:hypothetical protein